MSVPGRCDSCGRFASANRTQCRHCSTRSTTRARTTTNDPLNNWDAFQAAEGQALTDLLTALD